MLESLMSRGTIGTLTIRNRLVFAPVEPLAGLAGGRVPANLTDFYKERGLGGAGLVIVGHVYSWPEQAEGCLGLWEDGQIPGWRELTKQVKDTGAAIAVQLGGRGVRRHNGEAVAPTAMTFACDPARPRALEVKEIKEFARAYGEAAARAREAGFDAVEIHAAHGKLLSLFLSPYSNRRTDEYGGSTENRCRFAGEILKAIHERAGSDFPVIFRYSADDMLTGGVTEEEGIAIALEMKKSGVSAFHVSAGNQEQSWTTSFSFFWPHECLVRYAAPVRKATGLPVITVGKISDAVSADRIIRDEKADFVAMARPLIADPYLLKKTLEGRPQDIRRCIYCLNCTTAKERRLSTPGLCCTVNPFVLREGSFRLTPTASPKKIMVIGGGLSGMEAALVLAQRGHDVEIREASPALGGQWLAASASPDKNDFKTLIPYLTHSLRQAGVRIFTNSPVTETDIAAAQADMFILATGAIPRELPVEKLPGAPEVVQGMDVLLGKPVRGPNVVVVGGRYIGLEAADLLAGQGMQVSLVEALELGHGTIHRISDMYRNRLVDKGVYLYPNAPVLRLSRGGVDIADHGSLLKIPADTVVTAIGTVPVRNLQDVLEKDGRPWYGTGDCTGIGDALLAIRSGAELGISLP